MRGRREGGRGRVFWRCYSPSLRQVILCPNTDFRQPLDHLPHISVTGEHQEDGGYPQSHHTQTKTTDVIETKENTIISFTNTFSLIMNLSSKRTPLGVQLTTDSLPYICWQRISPVLYSDAGNVSRRWPSHHSISTSHSWHSSPAGRGGGIVVWGI